MTDCTLLFPGDLGYSTFLVMENRLEGTFRIADPSDGFDFTAPAVALEADPASFDPGDATFYSRYMGSLDAREPLPSSATVDYSLSPTVDSHFFLWRDGRGPNPFACATPPAPLSDASVLVAPVDSSTDENLSFPAPYEADAFAFSDLGAAAGLDGSSSGRATFTLPSQVWVVGNGVPAAADLAISKTDAMTTVTPGSTLTYTIVASNLGPSDVAGASVNDPFPVGLSCTWTCQGAGGGSCPSNGTGDIAALIDLPVGATATFLANCAVDSGLAPGTQIVNIATVAPPNDATDPSAPNDVATDVTAAGQIAAIPTASGLGLGLLVVALALAGIARVVLRRRTAG